MEIMLVDERKTECKFFLDGDKGVLLDFSKVEDLMISTVRVFSYITKVTIMI